MARLAYAPLPMRTPAVLVLVASCASAQSQSQPRPPAQRRAQGAADADSARAFARKTNEDLKRLQIDDNVAQWIKATYITEDTERMAAEHDEVVLGYTAQAVKDAARWNGVQLDPDTARTLYLLRTGSALAAPSDPAKRLELTTLANRLEGI